MLAAKDAGPVVPPEPEVEPLLAAVQAAIAARDPGALSDELTRVVAWVRERGGLCVDDMYLRWLQVMHVFRELDLSLWEERPHRVEELAITLAHVDYYRQLDLSIEERMALLVRARKLLSLSHHLGRARIDLERAELASMRGTPEDMAEALSLCDDALASVEQIDDARGQADGLFSRALVLLRLERYREAASEAEKARKIFERENIRVSIGNVCWLLAALNVNWDRPVNAVPLVREAIQIYDEVEDSVGTARMLLIRAITWKARGALPNALQDCETAVVLYDRARMRTAQGRALMQRAAYLANLARYSEAQHDLEQAAGYLAQSPEAEVFVQALVQLADVLRRRNLQEEAAARLDQAEALMEQPLHPRTQLAMALQIASIARELATPDRPRIRRCAAAALVLSQAVGDEERERSARTFLAFAG